MSHRYKLIGCEILFREVCMCAARSPNVIDPEFMPKGLHDLGEKNMTAQLQARIDAVDIERYEAILLCYGLCNYGTKGLSANIPIVMPRAHDCITLLMGSKDKYKDYFFSNPGTLFMSSGWIERSKDPGAIENSIPAKLGMRVDLEAYDEEDAAYIKEILGDWVRNYSKYAFIDNGTGVPPTYEEKVKAQAAEKNWRYERVAGDVRLIQNLMDGVWDSADILYVPPMHRITATNEDTIVSCEQIV